MALINLKAVPFIYFIFSLWSQGIENWFKPAQRVGRELLFEYREVLWECRKNGAIRLQEPRAAGPALARLLSLLSFCFSLSHCLHYFCLFLLSCLFLFSFVLSFLSPWFPHFLSLRLCVPSLLSHGILKSVHLSVLFSLQTNFSWILSFMTLMCTKHEVPIMVA